MDGNWKKSFLDRLNQAQTNWVREFEESVEKAVGPAFDEMRGFLAENGFRVSKPLREEGRRSFKFELAENAYLLVLFRSAGIGEFEIRAECFVPGQQPLLTKAIARNKDLNPTWAQQQFETALDNFVGLLAGEQMEAPQEELVGV
ncbi:MAG: hypothetical protein SF069_10080 [Phycisphaerae bacterium]|nr:hypothetical protein [Phycisphaerae bacterium]